MSIPSSSFCHPGQVCFEVVFPHLGSHQTLQINMTHDISIIFSHRYLCVWLFSALLCILYELTLVDQYKSIAKNCCNIASDKTVCFVVCVESLTFPLQLLSL